MEENKIPTNEEDVPSQTKEENVVSTRNQNPESPQEQNNNQRNIIVVVIVLIILGGFVWAADRYLPLRNSEPTACTTEAKLCPDGSAVGRTGPNCEFTVCSDVRFETERWWTYRNTQYGFELKYPRDWDFKEYIKEDPPFVEFSKVDAAPLRYRLLDGVQVRVYPGRGITDEDVALYLSSYGTPEPFVFDDWTGFTVSNGVIHGVTNFVHIILATKKLADGRSIRVEWLRVPGQDSTIDVEGFLPALLSTVTAVERLDTSAWKTYRNDRYGFEFKYPPTHTPFSYIKLGNPQPPDDARENGDTYSYIDKNGDTVNGRVSGAEYTEHKSYNELVTASTTSRHVAIAGNESKLFCCETGTFSVSVLENNIDPKEVLPVWPVIKGEVETGTFLGRDVIRSYAKHGGEIGYPYQAILVPFDTHILYIWQGARADILDHIFSTFRFIDF